MKILKEGGEIKARVSKEEAAAFCVVCPSCFSGLRYEENEDICWSEIWRVGGRRGHRVRGLVTFYECQKCGARWRSEMYDEQVIGEGEYFCYRIEEKVDEDWRTKERILLQ